MAEARRIALDPADPTRGYIAWSHGPVQPFGGAPPSGFAGRWSTGDPVTAFQVLDFVTPSGWVGTSDGAIRTFGAAVGQYPAVAPEFRVYAHLSMNPANDGRGYFMTVFGGQPLKVGLSVPNLAVTPPSFSYAAVAAWAHDWTSGDWIMLLANGGMHSSTGITGYTATVKPGRSVYRALAVREWDATPAFWVADYAGSVFRGNGAEEANRGVLFPGRDVVRDLAVVSDGTGGDPLELCLLTAPGGQHRWITSSAPTVTITEPSSDVTTTTRPVVEWTYSDPNGDAQRAYDVRLFTAAQAAVPGFDPGASPYLARWNEQTRTEFRQQVDFDMVNGDYRFAVRARNTAGLLSPWDSINFTVNVPPLDTPALTAVVADWDVELTVTGAVVGGTVEVQHRDGDGDWSTFVATEPDETGSLDVVDRRAPLNGTRTYRARARTGDPTVASPWSVEVEATLQEETVWLLSAAGSIDDPLVLDVVPDLSWTEPVTNSTHRPPFRRHALVVRGRRQSAEGDLTVRVATAAERANLDALLSDTAGVTRTLLLRSPYAQHWFLEINGPVVWDMVHLPGEDRTLADWHEVTIPFVQVSAPPVQATQVTYLTGGP